MEGDADAAAAPAEDALCVAVEEAADHDHLRQDTMDVTDAAVAAADIAAASPCPDCERANHSIDTGHAGHRSHHADAHSPHCADEEGADYSIAHQ